MGFAGPDHQLVWGGRSFYFRLFLSLTPGPFAILGDEDDASVLKGGEDLRASIYTAAKLTFGCLQPCDGRVGDA